VQLHTVLAARAARAATPRRCVRRAGRLRLTRFVSGRCPGRRRRLAVRRRRVGRSHVAVSPFLP
jgi:hypothetical protein